MTVTLRRSYRCSTRRSNHPVFSRIANSVAAIAGAGLASQFPAFYLQYVQRLGGHLDHARLGGERIGTAANALGMSVDELLGKFLTNTDPVFRALGELHVQTVSDVGRLGAAEAAMISATALERPFALATHFDWAIADGVWRAFEPAVPLSFEGLIYTGIGMAFGLAALAAVQWAVRWRSRRVARAAE